MNTKLAEHLLLTLVIMESLFITYYFSTYIFIYKFICILVPLIETADHTDHTVQLISPYNWSSLST